MFTLNGFKVYKRDRIIVTNGQITLMFKSYDEMLEVLFGLY